MQVQISAADWDQLSEEMTIPIFSDSDDPEAVSLRLGSKLLHGQATFRHGKESTLCEMDWKTEDSSIKIQAHNHPKITFCIALEGCVPYRYTKCMPEEIWHGGDMNLWVVGEDASYCILPAQSRVHMKELCLTPEYIGRLANQYPEMLGQFGEDVENGKTFRLETRSLMREPNLLQAMNAMQQTYIHGPAQRAYNDAKVIEIFALMFGVTESTERLSASINRDFEKLEEARRILLERFQDPPSLQELSRLAYINEFKLKQGFKRCYGNTVFGVLFDYRMEMACRYLLDTDKTIQQVGELCGYCYNSHFTTAFKRKMGVNPLEYRQRMRNRY